MKDSEELRPIVTVGFGSSFPIFTANFFEFEIRASFLSVQKEVFEAEVLDFLRPVAE